MIRSPLVILLILCLLVNACDGRCYGLKNEVSVHHPEKVGTLGDKLGPTVEGKTVAEQGGSTTSRLVHDGVASHQRPRKHRGISKGNTKEAISVVEKKSVVSWHVPSKHHDQHPGIYSDYPKPRSRPPSHN